MKLVRPHSTDTVWGSTGTTMLNCKVDFEIALPRYALKTLPPPPLSLFKILKAKRGGGPASVPPLTTSYVLQHILLPPRYRLGTASVPPLTTSYVLQHILPPPRYRLGTASHNVPCFTTHSAPTTVPPLTTSYVLQHILLPPRYRLS